MKRLGKIMKIIIYNSFMIILFFILYMVFKKDFATTAPGGVITTLDLFNLSSTIQTAVGITLIYPITTIGKWLNIIQQLLLIFGNLLIFHT